MKKGSEHFALPVMLAVVLITSAVSATTTWAQGRTVLDGVYTTAQATRGEEAYKANCVNCHGTELRGGGGGAAPTLRSDVFLDRWREDSLSALYDKMKTTMPRNNQRNTLGDPTYTAILAFLLQVNEFPTGSQELTTANLSDIRLITKEGPKALPNNTQVAIVGCLTAAGTEWSLTKAADPLRNRKPTETNPQELQGFTSVPLGSQTFQVRNLDFLDPPFDPAPHAGHKVVVKGVMARTGSTSRIAANLVSMLGESCQ